VADIDVAVIGAGVVGLACAAALAKRGRQVAILEKNRRIGQETTSRNSGVIHAGLYYPTGSLKARLCVEGRQLLYERCRRDDVPHRRCGKILIATDDEERRKLEAIHALGLANGAGALELLDGAAVARREPRVRAVAGLFSPESGIVDTHALCESYLREAEAAGALLALDNEVVALAPGWRVEVRTSAGASDELAARFVVNAAGLDAPRIAALAGIDVDARRWRQHLCKGDYFRLATRHAGLVRHLVYPVPAQAGLGIHITFDLGGKLTAGPDVEYVDRVRYDVDPSKAARFGAAVRRYLPDVRDEDLEPDYAGVRPKLAGPGEPFRDFVVEEEGGLVNLVGIESPGLTAAGAIALRVAELLDR
jgi:L-2-hydroxyglutarate oxidase LhgO